MNTIEGIAWFTGRSTIGIVQISNSSKEKKAYIASVNGLNEKLDAVFIAQNGVKFPIDEAISIIEKRGIPIKIYYG